MVRLNCPSGRAKLTDLSSQEIGHAGKLIVDWCDRHTLTQDEHSRATCVRTLLEYEGLPCPRHGVGSDRDTVLDLGDAASLRATEFTNTGV